MARRLEPASSTATSSSSVAGKPVTDADELVEAMAAAGDTFEVKIVRGVEERTITVGGETTASGEA